MSWNYRVVRFKDELPSVSEDGYWYEIREVFYNRDGSLMGHSEASVASDSVEGIMKVLDMMRADAHKAVIDEAEFYTGDKNKTRVTYDRWENGELVERKEWDNGDEE